MEYGNYVFHIVCGLWNQRCVAFQTLITRMSAQKNRQAHSQPFVFSTVILREPREFLQHCGNLFTIFVVSLDVALVIQYW